MTHMIGADYSTPDTAKQIDDALRIGGGLIVIASAFVATWVSIKKWWHRKRDRQERILREHIQGLRDEILVHNETVTKQLDDIQSDVTEVKSDVKDVRIAQATHITDHATGKFHR